MSDDFLGIPIDNAPDVPADVSTNNLNYGEEVLTNTGEQNQSLAGNAAFNDATRPNQTTNSAGSVANTTDYGDYGAPTPVGAAGTSNTSATSPYTAPPVPRSVPAVTQASAPTQDAYGLTILDAAQTKEITRNINPAFINSLVDPNSPPTETAAKAVNTAPAGLKPFVDENGVVFDPVTFTSYPVDSKGKQIVPADVAANIDPAAVAKIQEFDRQPTLTAAAQTDPSVVAKSDSVPKISTTTPVDPGKSNLAGPPDTFVKDADGNWVENPKYPRVVEARPITEPANKSATATATPPTTSAAPVATPSPYTETRQTAQDAAKLNQYSEFPDPYLTKITKAQENIDAAQAKIAPAQKSVDEYKSNIDLARTNLAQTQAKIDATTDPDTQAALLKQQQETLKYIDQQTLLLDQSKDIVKQNTDIVTANNDAINENAQAYKDSKKTVVTDQVPIDTTKGLAPPMPDQTQAETNRLLAQNAQAAEIGAAYARQQAELAKQRKIANNQDWRVRLSLSPNATYLYNDKSNTILQPLSVTGGVIFPYTPRIETSYKADYEAYNLTHSNTRGYFYRNSYVDTVNITAVFTAQDSQEAQYLLAVMHFFKSVTKMFYGQDKNPIAGTPPPVVFLKGLGQYQFDNKPCVVTSFNLNLPADVDYIRANSPNIDGTNMLTRRNLQDLPTNPISGAVARLQNLWNSQKIMPGAAKQPQLVPNLSQNQPSYVPTKIELQISLLPIQSRRQMSRQFSLQKYASGALLGAGYDGANEARSTKGFW